MHAYIYHRRLLHNAYGIETYLHLSPWDLFLIRPLRFKRNKVPLPILVCMADNRTPFMNVNLPSVLYLKTPNTRLCHYYMHIDAFGLHSPRTPVFKAFATFYGTSACSEIFHRTDDGCRLFNLYQFSRAADLEYSSRLLPLPRGIDAVKKMQRNS